jgi:FkbM family methyltransferase
VLPFALSDVSGRLSFREEADGTTSHVTSHPGPSDANGAITVNVRTGDGVILSGEAAFPNLIKIDVEGHELEVVRGLSAALSDLRLRGVFVEVHFSISARPANAIDRRATTKSSVTSAYSYLLVFS